MNNLSDRKETIRVRDFFIVLSCILLSKSLYYESYGNNNLLIVFLLFLIISSMPKTGCFRLNLFSPVLSSKKSTSVFLKKCEKPIGFILSLSYLFGRQKQDFSLIIYVLLFMLIVVLNTDKSLNSTAVLFLRFIISIYVVRSISFNQFSNYFINIILIITLFSFLYFLIIYFDVGSLLFDFIAIDGRHLRNFVFFGVWDNFVKYSVYRNSGLWWEPGAFQIFINLAFIFSLINKTMGNKKYCVFMLGIVSSISTTGVIAFIFLSMAFWRHFFSIIKRRLLYIIIAIFFSILLFSMVVPFILFKFGLGATTEVSVSFLSRYYDFIISLNLFSNNMLLGYGYGQLTNTVSLGREYLGDDLYALVGPSGADGLSMLISQCGIFMFFLLSPFLLPKYYKTCDVFTKMLITISLILMFNTENFSFTLIFSLLSLYGITGNRQVDLDK